MTRAPIVLAAAILLIAPAFANANDEGRDFTAARDPRLPDPFEILDRPAQQIAIEVRLLQVQSTALGEFGVDGVVRAATVLTPRSDGLTGILATDLGPGGMIFLNRLARGIDDLDPDEMEPIGLGFFYQGQVLIDVRMDPATVRQYQPPSAPVGSDDALSNEFRQAMKSIGVADFGLPRPGDNRLPTQVLVTDGRTLVLGFPPGMRESREKLDIPLLSDIPMLGSLFAGRVSQTARGELIVFIQPAVTIDEGDE